MTATIEDLSGVPLFAGLSDAELGHVLEITKEVRFASGTPVVEADKSGIGFHLITRGSADVYVGDDKVSTFGPGDYFGEMSMLDGKPRSATVVANGDLTTLSIPSWDFEQLLGRNPSIMRALLVVLTERIRRSEALRS